MDLLAASHSGTKFHPQVRCRITTIPLGISKTGNRTRTGPIHAVRTVRKLRFSYAIVAYFHLAHRSNAGKEWIRFRRRSPTGEWNEQTSGKTHKSYHDTHEKSAQENCRNFYRRSYGGDAIKPWSTFTRVRGFSRTPPLPPVHLP